MINTLLYKVVNEEGSVGATTVILEEAGGLDLEWTVGGAFRVDSTQVNGRMENGQRRGA